MHVTRPANWSLHTFVWQNAQQTLEIKQKHGIHTSSFSWLCSFSPEPHPVLTNSSVGDTCLAESGLEITSYNLLLWFSRVVSSSIQLVDWSQCNFRIGSKHFLSEVGKMDEQDFSTDSCCTRLKGPLQLPPLGHSENRRLKLYIAVHNLRILFVGCY